MPDPKFFKILDVADTTTAASDTKLKAVSFSDESNNGADSKKATNAKLEVVKETFIPPPEKSNLHSCIISVDKLERPEHAVPIGLKMPSKVANEASIEPQLANKPKIVFGVTVGAVACLAVTGIALVTFALIVHFGFF